MYSRYEQRLASLQRPENAASLHGSLTGLEKEGLRVGPDGSIAQTPHPSVLGSALCHPYITTDYSEALLELITPPMDSVQGALNFLGETLQFVHPRLQDELLWSTSMPCVVAGESSIPLARYGTSNAGQMKTVYRRGLGHRYGRVMQVIAGVHFNYSFADSFWQIYQDIEQDRQPAQAFISARYFDLIRNLQRYGWLIPYLFGASPAVCKSFLHGQQTSLEEFNDTTYYEPYATSLRMGDIGYQNNQEYATGIKANYDSLQTYVESLTCAINTPYPDYEKIGVKRNGRYEQLNANLLQIENEYYSTVRPKQILNGNEKPSLALARRGVRYIELRSLDINAFDPLGINEQQLQFLEIFITFCLLQDSPPISDTERSAIDANQMAAAHRGRDPHLQLQRDGQAISLRDWALELCRLMEGAADLQDRAHGGQVYRRALAAQQEVARDPDRTPSARMLAEMRAHGVGFYHFAKRMSETHHQHFIDLSHSADKTDFFTDAAAASLQAQQAMEASDTLSFDDYLRAYFAQSL